MEQVIIIAGATAWISVALVTKSGPWNVLLAFRNFIHRLTYGKSPLSCTFCTSFWVGLVLVSAWYGGTDEIKALITLFGILGIAMWLRGSAGDYSA